MNPNNQNTKKSPWILCQSKSTPGKFYYFNVVTGVKAWCEDYENVKNEQRTRNISDVSRISFERLHQRNNSNEQYNTYTIPHSYNIPITSNRQHIDPHSPPRTSQFNSNVYITPSTSHQQLAPSNPKDKFPITMSGSSEIYEKSLPFMEDPRISRFGNSNDRDVIKKNFERSVPSSCQDYKLNSTELHEPNFYVSQGYSPNFRSNSFHNTQKFSPHNFPSSLVDERQILPPKNHNIENKLPATDANTEVPYTIRITVNNEPKNNITQDVTESHIKASMSSSYPLSNNQNVINKTDTDTKHQSKAMATFQPSPLFGQAVFSRYGTNEPLNNILWAPIQIPTVIMQNPPEINSKIDRHTQTSQESEESIVQACDIPLSKRFSYISTPANNQIITRSQIFDIANHNVGVDIENHNVVASFTSNEEPVPTINPIQNRDSFRYENNKTVNDSYIYNINSLKNLDCTELEFRNSTTNEVGRETMNSAEKNFNLRTNDLRFLLLAKKNRNRSDEDVPNFEGVTTIKTYQDDKQVINKPKKRVTFLLEDENYTEDDTTNDVNDIEDNIIQDEFPKLQAVRYVLVDANTLIDDFEAIEKYVQSDKKLRLIITERLKSDIEAMCFGDCGGQQRVIVARKITRRFLAPPPCYVFCSDINNSCHVKQDADIITCCLKLIRNGIEVVLISNDQKIYSEAKTFDIHCFRTSDLPHLAYPKPEITFDLKKITRSTELNTIRDDQGIDLNDIHSYSINNNNHNQNLREQSSTGHFFPINNIKKVNANTSPGIHAENKFQNRVKESLNYEKLCRNTRIDEQIIYTNEYNRLDNYIEKNRPNESYYEEENADDRLCSEFEIQYNKSIFDEVEGNIHTSHLKTNNYLNKFEIQNSDIRKENCYYKNHSNIQDRKVFDEPQMGKSKLDIERTQSIFAIQDQNENRPIFKKIDTKVFEPKQVDVVNAYPKSQSIFEIQSPETTKELNLKNDPAPTKKMFNFEEAYILDYYLETFHIKNDVMHGRIRNRFDEWVCTFTQIIEDTLTQVLMRHKIFTGNVTQLEILHDLIYGIEDFDVYNNELKLISNKFISMYTSECDRKGKLNYYMKPLDFMQLFGCGMVLIQELKENNPTYQELSEAEHSLSNLLEVLENPQPDAESLTFEAPKFDRKEIDFDTEKLTRSNFVKTRSHIIKYLKAHFEDWKNFIEDTQQNDIIQNEVKVVRTVGRNLNLLKLDNKNITFNNCTEINPATSNTEDVNKETTNNVVITKNTTEKLDELGLEENNYENEKEQNEVSLDSVSFVYAIKVGKKNDKNKNDNSDKISNNNVNINIVNVKDDSTVDSGIENESLQAHSLVKMFLSEISESFNDIYTFIDVSVTQLYDDAIKEDEKRLLRDRANRSHENIAYIIERLKSIIQREANERTALKEIILKAGIEASTDKKITRYGQVVTKCLEQAKILERALKTILNFIDGQYQISLHSDSSNSNLRYFNIFE